MPMDIPSLQQMGQAGERCNSQPAARISKKSPKKSDDTELQSSSEKSTVGRNNQKKGTNPFGDSEPIAEEKSQGLQNTFGGFRMSKKMSRKQSEGEQQSSPGTESTNRRDYKDQEQKDGTNPFEESQPQAGVKSQGLSKPFGSFRISKKSRKNSNDTKLPRSPEKSNAGKDNKAQEEKGEAKLFEESDSKAEEKSPGVPNPFGPFRISKKNLKKPQEAEEPSSPEKKESPAGLGQMFKGSKRGGKRNSQVEELNSPDKKEPFGQLGARLSKIYNKKKHEHAEEPNSPDKKESSLVQKVKTSMKAKKKIDFNEPEDNNRIEELRQDKMEAVEEENILSVMQINELIHSRQLQKAFRSIKFMEDKLIEECKGDNYYENITEFTIRARDVDLLYGSLFNMVRSIVKETLDQEVDEPLAAAVVYVIENEAILHENTSVPLGNSEIILGQPRRWKHLWKEAVKDCVAKRIESVPHNPTEESWLPKHLANLKINTLQDLLKVKNSLMSLYPEDYKVCSTYLRSFHDALSSHLQKNVVTHASEPSQLYSLLDFIMNKYKSEEFMGNPELHPEINTASLQPVLQGECFEKLKRDYITALKGIIQKYFQKILEMEMKTWEKGEEVEEEIFKELPLFTDIEHIIGTHVRESSKLSEELETFSFHICVEHLGSFSTRLQETFMKWSGNNFNPVAVQYSVVYINSLTKLRHNTTQSDAEQCRIAETNLNTAIETLKQHIFHLFTKDTKPHFQKLITKKWLKKCTAFSAIMKSAKILCGCVMHFTSPHDKEMACRVHKYLVKEYIAQIMKRKMSLNKLNRKKAAEKMKEDGNLFNTVAEDMGSDRQGLYEVICCISEIIGSKKKEEIKPKLEELHHLYPDISDEHVLCILHVQGTGRSKKLLGHFHQLQKDHQPPNEPEEKLFSEIDCVTQVACFSLNLSG
ncbi:PREDICTED: exocyst complex component 3-like protein 4 [Nanorana parkeri]|uniref:exocyst complex component 3-like protein 4 n=1 Tax=Nanorana parkeri TaxID=125878 RepID=UPI00085501CE|nr:PREDICTED: exocyst complex component 3-like protein 4 [Nanorana parkeri]